MPGLIESIIDGLWEGHIIGRHNRNQREMIRLQQLQLQQQQAQPQLQQQVQLLQQQVELLQLQVQILQRQVADLQSHHGQTPHPLPKPSQPPSFESLLRID
jgi:hypothetical protein